MNKLSQITFCFFILLQFSAFAQQPAAGSRPGGSTPPLSGPGHLFGKIVDEKGAAVSYASVLVLQSRFDSLSAKNKDVLLKGVASTANGEFSIEDLPVGTALKLQISYLGYFTHEQAITIQAGRSGGGIPLFEKDLGKIVLKENAQVLKGAVVTANQLTMRLDLDKTVFNVGQNTVSAGGTGVDVMKNVPGVTVDIDGNVTLRNSSPQIFLDGRPTTLTLEQIPADAIESIEVITNPSAKYDASGGGAGIINIVLKKNRKTGYNGGIRAGVSQLGEANLGGDLNLRQNKINFTGSAMGRLHQGRTFGTVDRSNLSNGVEQSTVYQTNTDRMSGGMVFVKAGIDYLATNRTTFSLSGVRWHGNFSPVSVLDIYTKDLLVNPPLTTFSKRKSESSRLMNNSGIVFGMKHLFPTEGEEFTIDANYFKGKYNASVLFGTDYYSGDEFSSIDNSILQKIIGSGSDENLILQTDYVKPFKKSMKLETGLRAALRNREILNSNYTFSDALNEYTLQYNPAGNYRISDNVFAAYATVSHTIKSFGYKIGLRAESSSYTGELTDTKQIYSNRFPVSLFPSIFLTQKISPTRDIQLSVTRRVNRPNFMQLNPFVDSTDKYNISQGNPALVPEFTQSAELSFMKRFKKNNSLLVAAYYKQTNDLITRYLRQENDGTIINTYINANSAYSTGAEITSQNNISKWWSMTTNLNFYNSGINADNIQQVSQKSMWSWFGKMNNNFKLAKTYTIQLSAMYQSRTNIPASGSGGGGGGGPWNMQAQSASQGYIKAFYAVDIAVKKTFMKDKAALSVSVNDIFRTRYTTVYSESPFFIQEYSRINNPRIVRLNFSYSFGKMDAVLFKRKTKGTGEDIGQ